MQTTTIKVPAGTEYLSEVMSALPSNCLFNKGIVGGGGTTIALTNDLPMVICVPFKSLIQNKIKQSIEKPEMYPHEIFGLYGKTSNTQLSNYLMTATVPKIMVTYDSLHKVLANNYVVGKDYILLIDEYHCLFKEFPYRRKACMNVLNHYNDFKSYTFMTATPIERDFLFDELKHIPECNAEWEQAQDVKIIAKKCQSGVDKVVIKHIKDILSMNKPGNRYFFVNSVRFIKVMIRNCKLTASNCRVICSETNTPNMPIAIQTPNDPAKKINFITKTAFEGADFYDEDGITYIVSDGTNSLTLVDISTQFLQIAGRIRNSKYRRTMHHLYSTTRYSENVSYDDFKAMMSENLADETEYVVGINRFTTIKHRQEAASGRKLLYHIMDEETGEVKYDNKTALIDLYNYRVMHRDYKSSVNLEKEYLKNNLTDTDWVVAHAAVDIIPVLETNFKYNVQELERLSQREDGTQGTEYKTYLHALKDQYSFLEQAIVDIGFDEIKRLNYHVTSVQRALIKCSPRESETSDMGRLQQLLVLNPSFKPGRMQTLDHVKETLQQYYDELGIKKNALANQIENYFVVKESRKMVGGKKQRAYTILSAKPLD